MKQSDYAADDASIRAQLVPSTDSGAQTRADATVQRLAAGTRVEGLNCKAVVFKFSYPSAFAVPDGTLFISDSLVNGASDSELAAVIAHLMGHVRYGNYSDYREASGSKAQQVSYWRTHPVASVAIMVVVVPILVACITLLPLCQDIMQVGTERQARALAHSQVAPVYKPHERAVVDSHREEERREELEANWAAEGYLAQVGIPPAVLFEALSNLRLDAPSEQVVWREGSKLDYGAMQSHRDNGAIDLGRMLDAGIVHGQ